uniref:Uncharacterized protein n=1 Tax=Panagrolaimus sp. JU765 TaxID=591449 RepID=A0AC34R4M7_9BILA
MASADITSISMRTFLATSSDEPLNANRLKYSDRKLGEEFEVKSFLPPSGHGKAVNGFFHSPIAVGKALGFGESSKPPIHKPTPIPAAQMLSPGLTSNGILPEVTRRASGVRAKVAQSDEDNGRASSCSDQIADNEVSETMKSSEGSQGSQPDTSRIILVPTKWQVLYFVAHTNALRIKRTGCELQVTDTSNFPLFDIFQKPHCFRSTWILESYGRQVLVIVDASKSFSQRRRNEPQVFNVINSENEEMGNFITGDPFVIQNAEKAVVARYSSFEGTDPRLRNWQCILDGTGQEICILEHRRPNVYFVRFAPQIGYILKLMLLAASVQICTMNSPCHQRNPCCNLM